MTPSTRSSSFWKPNSSEARSVADGNLADVADAHRHAVIVAHDNVADVFGLGDQPKSAHVEELRTLRVKAAAGVGVVGGQRIEHLRQAECGSCKSWRGRAAPGTASRCRRSRNRRPRRARTCTRARSPSPHTSSVLAACGRGFRSRSDKPGWTGSTSGARLPVTPGGRLAVESRSNTTCRAK